MSTATHEYYVLSSIVINMSLSSIFTFYSMYLVITKRLYNIDKTSLFLWLLYQVKFIMNMVGNGIYARNFKLYSERIFKSGDTSIPTFALINVIFVDIFIDLAMRICYCFFTYQVLFAFFLIKANDFREFMKLRASQTKEKRIIILLRLISGIFVIISNTLFLTIGSNVIGSTAFWILNLIVQLVVFLVDLYVITILCLAI